MAWSPLPCSRSSWSALISLRYFHRKYAKLAGIPKPYSANDRLAMATMRPWMPSRLHRMVGSAFNTLAAPVPEQWNGVSVDRTTTGDLHAHVTTTSKVTATPVTVDATAATVKHGSQQAHMHTHRGTSGTRQ
jgi:hypothetical protein